MTNSSEPKDGDFTSYLESISRQEGGTRRVEDSGVALNDSNDGSPSAGSTKRQTINDVFNGQEPTDEFLEELSALENAPALSDEEFERQALSAPGADGDVGTPE